MELASTLHNFFTHFLQICAAFLMYITYNGFRREKWGVVAVTYWMGVAPVYMHCEDETICSSFV
jgi:hypothetical protein